MTLVVIADESPGTSLYTILGVSIMFVLFVFAVVFLAVSSAAAFVVEYGHDLYLAVKYRKVNKIINSQPRIRY